MLVAIHYLPPVKVPAGLLAAVQLEAPCRLMLHEVMLLVVMLHVVMEQDLNRIMLALAEVHGRQQVKVLYLAPEGHLDRACTAHTGDEHLFMPTKLLRITKQNLKILPITSKHGILHLKKSQFITNTVRFIHLRTFTT